MLGTTTKNKCQVFTTKTATTTVMTFTPENKLKFHLSA